MLIENITMKEFKDGLKKTDTVIVPYGTVEAHGTHLPLSTDTIIIREAVKKAAEKIDVFIAPPIHYGVCTSTSDHPGTIGISPETVRRITSDIVRDLRKKGLKRFILISGHGGSIHVSAMKEAAEALTTEFRDEGGRGGVDNGIQGHNHCRLLGLRDFTQRGSLYRADRGGFARRRDRDLFGALSFERAC